MKPSEVNEIRTAILERDDKIVEQIEEIEKLKAERDALHKYINDLNVGQLAAEAGYAADIDKLKSQLSIAVEAFTDILNISGKYDGSDKLMKAKDITSEAIHKIQGGKDE